MAAVINTNVASLNAQRNLNTSQSQLATSLQRLSSGLRINSAKDDAAGLAISQRFSTQVRGMDQAARNANDGISLAQTAEGALGEIGNNLQRIRELAVQSRNATNSADDRAALQKEVNQLKEEIGRVAKETDFNGTKLLNGSFTAQSFQVGANQGQTIEIAGIVNANTSQLGRWTSVDTPNASTKSGEFTAVTLADTEKFTLDVAGVTILSVTAGTGGDTISAARIDEKLADTGTLQDLKTAGVTFSGSAAGGNLVFSRVNDMATFDIEVTNDGSGGFTATGSDFAAGTANTIDNGIAGSSKTGFADLDISTTAGADNAILAMDAALNSVNDARADLGAIQNRFSSVVTNLQTSSENLSAARSRIMDTDFAAETANLTRGQILQQAGTAMLAQANSLPNGVLALLRG